MTLTLERRNEIADLLMEQYLLDIKNLGNIGFGICLSLRNLRNRDIITGYEYYTFQFFMKIRYGKDRTVHQYWWNSRYRKVRIDFIKSLKEL